ncbi:MAG: hypothetical protein HY360_08395 [Verrucomicrobia bacterium]|nr:hypothetical protein [Verrucomicrobiota bacterium]
MKRTILLLHHLLLLALCKDVSAQMIDPTEKEAPIPKSLVAACKACAEDILQDLKKIKDKYPQFKEIERVKVSEPEQQHVLIRMGYTHDITRVEWKEEDIRDFPPNEGPSTTQKIVNGPAAIRMRLAFFIKEMAGMESTKEFPLDEVFKDLKCCIGIRPGKLQSEPVGKEIVDIVEKRVNELRAKFKSKP